MTLELPQPEQDGTMSVEQAIGKRRSVRRFADRELTPEQIGQIAWAAQGITSSGRRHRASPSAGALFPMELYLVTASSAFHYLPGEHRLQSHKEGDLRGELADAALGQSFVRQAPLNVVIAAVYERVTGKYGRRGVLYTHVEAGHIGQNVHLQAVAMGLGSVPVGAFRPDEVQQVLDLPEEQVPLYIIPVGYAV